MKKTIKNLSFLASVGLIFSGCMGGSPKPYTQDIKPYENVPASLKQRVVNDIVWVNTELAGDGKYTRYWGDIKASDGCVSTYHRGDKYKHCYIVSKSNKVEKKDFSKCNSKYGGCWYSDTHMEYYLDALNKVEEGLQKDLALRLKKYPKFSEMYDKEFKNFEETTKDIKVMINDKTKILPKEILKQLNSSLYYRKLYYDKEELFSRYDHHNMKELSEDIKNNFRINTCINKKCFSSLEKIGNWEILFDKTKANYNYSAAPKNIIFNVKKVVYSYYPKNFNISDKNIKVEVKNGETEVLGKFGYIKENSILKFVIYNKTNQFVIIDSIVGYYDEIVSVNLLPYPIKLAPKSYQTLAENHISFGKYQSLEKHMRTDFPSKSMLIYQKKSSDDKKTTKQFYNYKVPYGFSINYSISNKTYALYDKRFYSIDDIENDRK
jgi:hypothetical protein